MEFEILYAIQKMHAPLMDAVMVAISALGNAGIFWICAAAAMLFFKKTRRCGVLILISMLLCLLIGNIGLKNIVQRQRPCWLDQSVPLLIPVPLDFSFPSGHTMHGFTAAVMIFLHNKRAGSLALLLASAIAFSRMYLFVHFPTDILGGLVIGAVTALAVYIAAERMRRKALSGSAGEKGKEKAGR